MGNGDAFPPLCCGTEKCLEMGSGPRDIEIPALREAEGLMLQESRSLFSSKEQPHLFTPMCCTNILILKPNGGGIVGI